MATYTKLQDGSWGIRGQGLQPGKQVTVFKKDETSKTEIVGEVLKTFNDGNSIATIAKKARGGKAAVEVAKPVDANPDAPFVTKFTINVPNGVSKEFKALVDAFSRLVATTTTLRDFERARYSVAIEQDGRFTIEDAQHVRPAAGYQDEVAAEIQEAAQA